MGCPKLTWSDYIRPVEQAGKTAYSRISHKVTDDPIGNRVRYQDVSYAYNKLNQITSMSDAEQGSPFPFHYDNWGNLVKTPKWTYKFDLNNRLIEAKSPKVTVKYSYDPLGQRIKSVEKTSENVKTTEFLMSGMVEQARVTEDGEMWHTMGLDLANSFNSTGGVGAYLASSCGENSGVYLYDGNGNVSSTVQDGELKDMVVYSPFGKIEGRKELAFSFSSKPVDESGLSYYGARFYSVELRQWLTRDPIQENGGWNLYSFCSNNAISKIDLLGHWPGTITCTFSSPKSDTGWQVTAFLPSEDFANAGTSGGGMSDGVIIVYARTVVDNYSCPCYCPGTSTKTRTKKYSYTNTHMIDGGVEWSGIPGTWPPLSIADAIGSVVLGELTGGIIGNEQDRNIIEGISQSQAPAFTTWGTLVDDTGVPTRFCLWI